MALKGLRVIEALRRSGLSSVVALSACDNQLRLDDYLELVDQTGRIIASGKRGAIPPHLAPILQRLQIDVDAWLDVMRGLSHFLGTAVGALATLVCEATRRGVKWIAEKTRIHRDRRGCAPPAVDPALG